MFRAPRGPLAAIATLALAAGLATCGESPTEALPAIKVGFVVQPGTVTAGAPIAPAIQIAALDAKGNVVTTATGNVTLAITPGTGASDGVLNGVLTQQAVNGVATFTGLTIVRAAAGYTLTATSVGLTLATSSPFTVLPAAPQKLIIKTQPTNAVAGVAISPAVEIAVQDTFSNTVTSASTSIALAISSGAGATGASLAGTVTGSAANGVESVANLSIDKAASGYTLTATAQGLAGATTAAFAISPGAPTRLGVITQPNDVAAGSPISPGVQIAVLDALNNTVTTATNGVTVALGSNPGGATLGGTPTVAPNGGVASFADLTLDKAATGYTLVASTTGLIGATTTPFATSPGAAAVLALSTGAAGAASGAAFTTQPIVAVRDAAGNILTSDNTTVVTMTVTTGATVIGTSTATATAGVATFIGAGLSGTAGTAYTLTFSKSGLTAATQAITPTFGTASQFALATPAAGAPNGAAFTTQPIVAVRDAAGNTVTSDNGTIVTMTASVGATVVGTSAVTAVAGVATFTNVGISGTPFATYTLTFSRSGLAAVTQTIATTTTATQLALATSASGAPSGGPFATQPVIVIQDATGNTVTNDNNSVVTMTVSSGAAAVGTTTATAVAGVAAFTNVGISGISGTSYTLTFSKAGLTSATQPISPVAGIATQLVLTTSAAGAASGAAFTTQPAIAVRDGAGNTIANDNSSIVTMTVSTGAAILGTATATASGGIATFGNVGVSGTAGTSYTLTFSKTGLTAATQAISPTFGVATQLVLTTGAAGAASGAAFATQPVVAVRDGAGNTATSDNSTIVSLTVSAGATVVGTATATTVAGIATFTTVGISGPLGSYTLTFSKTALTPASQSISISSAIATQLVLTTSGAGAASGAAFTTQPIVMLRDVAGNAVTSDNSTVVTMTASAGATVVGTVTATAAGGAATFANVGISGISGTSYTLTFSKAGLSPATQAISLTFGVPTQLVLTTSAAGAPSGAAFTTQPVIAIRDGAGNAVTNDNSTIVTMSVSSGAGVVGTATSTAVAGVATFANVGISGITGTSYTLTFSKTGVAAATQSISPTFGVAAQLGLVTTAVGAASGAAFSTQPAIAVRDGAGNTVMNDNASIVTMSVSSGATVVGTATATAVAGIATFANAGINAIVGSYTLTFGRTGLQSASQSVSLSSGVAAQLVLTTSAAGAPSGAAFTTQPIVTVRDATGNTVTSDNGTIVSMTVSSGATMVGATTATAVAGVATFANVGISGISGTSYTLTVSRTGLTSAAQPITPTAGPAAQLVFQTQPTNATAGKIPCGCASSSLLSTFSVVVADASGNVVTSDTRAITVAITSGTGTNGAALTGNPMMSTVSGVAVFSGSLAIDSATTIPYSLTASAPGSPTVSNGTSSTFTVSVGTPARLSYQVSPKSTFANAALNLDTTVRIAVQDAGGNTVTSSTDQITLSIASGTGSLLGTTTFNASSGIALVPSNVRVSTTGTFIIKATDNSRTNVSVTSDPFVAGAGTLANFVVEASAGGAIGSQAAGVPFNIRVTARDGFGNTVTSFSGGSNTVVLTSTGSLSGTPLTTPVFSNGLLLPESVTITSTGSFTITATGGGATGTSNAFTVTPGPVSPTQTTAGIAPGSVGASTAIIVQAKDANGNNRTATSGTVSMSVAGANTATPAVVDNQTGTYRATYTPVNVGTDSVTIAVGGSGIGGNPYISNVGIAFTSLDVREQNSCGLIAGGTAYCWGNNSSRQLGDGSSVGRQGLPKLVVGGLTFASVHPGAQHTCALTSAGVAYCWGINGDGELGDGTNVQEIAPVAVTGGLTFTTIAVGASHSCGLTSDGTAYCWGLNAGGQLGDGTTTSRMSPTAVSGGLTFQSIAAGGQNTCGLTTSRLAYCWGQNGEGQIGDGTIQTTTAGRVSPTQVTGGQTFDAISVGGSFVCGVVSSSGGSAFCWGIDAVGELGDGAFSNTPRTSPTQVIAPLLFRSISAGSNHVCALTTTAGAHCWGFNGSGQLGDGTTTDRNVPTAVTNQSGFATIVSGGDHACALTTDSLAYCWGGNFQGQVGDGTFNVNRLTPVVVGNQGTVSCAVMFLGIGSAQATVSRAANGPSFHTSQTGNLQNIGTCAMPWSATSDQTWLTVSSTSGSVSANALTALTISVNLTGLQAGQVYTGTITFTTSTSGPPSSYTFRLTVNP